MSEKVLNHILEELKKLNTGQQNLELRQKNLELRQKSMEAQTGELVVGQKKLELRQKNLEAQTGELVVGQKNLELRQGEMNQVLTAVRTNQETTNAKLEALTMDVRRIEGNTIRIEKKMDEQFTEFHGEVRFLNHRIADAEMDVDKLKTKTS